MMRRPIKKITSMIIGGVAMMSAGNAAALTVSTTETPGAGDIISWTGSLDINVEFSTFGAGSYTSNFFPSAHDIGRLDVALVLNDPAQVPEPAAARSLPPA